MFTGIIEETGIVERINFTGNSGNIKIRAKKVLEGTKIGDSIAVNGICLTVVSMTGDSFSADVMAETVRRSSLSQSTAGHRVNLERAMAADGRFGGHIVSGHIDGTGTISSIKTEENAVWYRIKAGDEILKHIVEKGSIAIDGISLTVADVQKNEFAVSVIPHTRRETILSDKKTGDAVNLETDVVGKYVEKLMGYMKKDSEEQENSGSGLTMESLRALL